jgi:hypothetical protein
MFGCRINEVMISEGFVNLLSLDWLAQEMVVRADISNLFICLQLREALQLQEAYTV